MEAANEIEITPEMIDAGVDVWLLGIDEAGSAVECIYRAMESARNKAQEHRTPNTA
jgi:hypothetical protein